ncbi:hypothetical protein [Sphaerisporangium perillae]|uniref:hypothetical protein n=1 Tax=Sphaerisporangium perillae TaxID=2935860 RepID=UPI0020102494|nr:hypothetical protein [Sphaerisporangium perillae]
MRWGAVAPPVAVVTIVALASLTGCASGEAPTAQRAAERFYSAVHAGQGEAACGLLTPRAAEDLPLGGESCAEAVLRARLPAADRPRPQAAPTQVWGDEAQVRLSGDTVFLHRFSRGWLVRAAGCTPRGEQPYRCEVGS